MLIEMLPAGIEALRRIAAGERGVMTSVYIGDERMPEVVTKHRAAAAVRAFDSLPAAQRRKVEQALTTRSGLQGFLTDAVMTPAPEKPVRQRRSSTGR
jgi:hypothetical protein